MIHALSFHFCPMCLQDFAMGCPEAEADDFVCDYHLEMLSLSQDQQNPASIQFDDLSWQCHLPSLKPLGLNIMLNLCNASVTQQLCRFSDHLSNLALQESHGTVLPVYVPWGLCELSRLIGERRVMETAVFIHLVAFEQPFYTMVC